jgi:germination protein YpeB
MMNEMGEDFSMRSMLNGGNGNTVIHGFNGLENLSVEYPELIYDGPFSDGQENREVKGLKGSEISETQAVEKFKQVFSGYRLENIKAVGETATGIKCFNVQADVKGELLFAQISKVEGKLVMFSYAGSCDGINYSDDECVETASQFISSLGISNMKPVWINLANNVYTINFAGEQNGVILYGDLIKVRVCAETNMVIGIEAKSYYTNHIEREIGTATLSRAQAELKLSEDISVESVRLALVPIGNSTEKLCYEFSGEFEGSTYYIYIDANSGRQVEMFKVIKSTEGTLLM